MITVTDLARDYLTSFDKDIRIEVKGGGCAGFSYDYNFNSDEPDPLDFIVDLGSDRRLIVDKTSLLFVIGTQLDYEKIGSQLGMEVITVSTICQPPGNIIPIHRDTFYLINQRYPTRTDLKVRANIYLEDWKLGHFVQYNNEISTHWNAGEGLLWDSSILHLSANAGMQNKYTLQVSGFLLE